MKDHIIHPNESLEVGKKFILSHPARDGIHSDKRERKKGKDQLQKMDTTKGKYRAKDRER